MTMKNEAAKFMLKEIDERLAKRRKPLECAKVIMLGRVRHRIQLCVELNDQDGKFLTELHQRMTEPARLKW